jgi:hypothetical protein
LPAGNPASLGAVEWATSRAVAIPAPDIDVTASHIQDNRMFKADAPISIRTELFRFSPPR